MPLVTRTNYNERGEAFETIDPAGKVSRTYADHAGRTTRTIQNFVPDDPAAANPCFTPGVERNVMVDIEYGPGGQMIALIARNPATGDQVTRYQYGVTLSDSNVASNELLRAEIYPDAADSADRVSYSYNRQGQRIKTTDQNGSVHEYTYDLLGRQTADTVNTLGTGVDGTVRRIGQTYEVRGMVETITSYSDTAGTTPVNEVQNEFNDFGQLITQYQEPSGAVNTSTSAKVQYTYADGSANTIRPESLIYPSGTVLAYLCDDTAADKLSRVRTLNWDGDDICRYSYLGLGTFVNTEYLQPQICLDYATGSGANPYTGFDVFGRVIDHWWKRTDSATDDVVHLQYGYDKASNRTHREDLVAQSLGKQFDELYEYDGLQRLQKFHRGLLTADKQAITAPALQQGWKLDALGNWDNFTQFNLDDNTQTLDQQRIANKVNEITSITRTVGDEWVTPQYDRNGNMTLMPQPNDPTQSYRATWDSWNRLMTLEEPNGSGGWQDFHLYQYNGQRWRMRVDYFTGGVFVETRFSMFSSDWRVLEVRPGATVPYDRTFVWGRRALDDLVLRAHVDKFVCSDVLGSAVASVNAATAAVVERMAYQAYGTPEELSTNFTPTPATDDWEFRFAGYRYESISGLYQVRWRYLNSRVGTWVSRDHLGYTDSLNLLKYVDCRPVNFIDPTGEVTYPDDPELGCSAHEQREIGGVLQRIRGIIVEEKRNCWLNDPDKPCACRAQLNDCLLAMIDSDLQFRCAEKTPQGNVAALRGKCSFAKGGPRKPGTNRECTACSKDELADSNITIAHSQFVPEGLSLRHPAYINRYQYFMSLILHELLHGCVGDHKDALGRPDAAHLAAEFMINCGGGYAGQIGKDILIRMFNPKYEPKVIDRFRQGPIISP